MSYLLRLLLLTLTYQVLAGTIQVPIAVVVSDPSPLFILPEGFLANLTISYGVLTQTGVLMGVQAWLRRMPNGFPIADNMVNFNLTIFNIGTNSKTMLNNTQTFATNIPAGVYGPFMGILPNYHFGTQLWAAANDALGAPAVLMTTLISSASTFTCVAPLPLDCAQRSGQLRYTGSYGVLQSNDNLLASFFGLTYAKGARYVAIISSTDNLYGPDAVNQAQLVGFQVLAHLRWNASGVFPDSFWDTLVQTLVSLDPDVVAMPQLSTESVVCLQFLNALKRANWIPKAISFASIQTGHSDLVFSETYGSLPWIPADRGDAFDIVAVAGRVEPWSSVANYTADMLSANPGFPAAFLSLSILGSMAILAFQYAIEATTLPLTTLGLITGLNTMSRASVGGTLSFSPNSHIISHTDRNIYQVNTDGASYNWILPVSIAQTEAVYPMKTWAERSSSLIMGYNQIYVLIAQFLGLVGNYGMITMIEQAYHIFFVRVLSQGQKWRMHSWLLASAIVYAIATWASMALGINALIPQNVYSTYSGITNDPIPLFSAFLLPLGGMLVVIELLFHFGVRFDSDGAPIADETSTTTSISTSSKNRVSLIEQTIISGKPDKYQVPTENSPKAIEMEQTLLSTGAVPASPSKSSLKPKQKIRWSFFRSLNRGQILIYFIASILLYLTNVFLHLILLKALVFSATMTLNAASLCLLSLLGVPIFFVALRGFIHSQKVWYRFVFALIMYIPTPIIQYTGFSTTSFTKILAPAPIYMNTSITLILASVLTVIIVFIGMGAAANAAKLTLSLQYARIDKLETQNQAIEALVHSLEADNDQYKAMNAEKALQLRVLNSIFCETKLVFHPLINEYITLLMFQSHNRRQLPLDKLNKLLQAKLTLNHILHDPISLAVFIRGVAEPRHDAENIHFVYDVENYLKTAAENQREFSRYLLNTYLTSGGGGYLNVSHSNYRLLVDQCTNGYITQLDLLKQLSTEVRRLVLGNNLDSTDNLNPLGRSAIEICIRIRNASSWYYDENSSSSPNKAIMKTANSLNVPDEEKQ